MAWFSYPMLLILQLQQSEEYKSLLLSQADRQRIFFDYENSLFELETLGLLYLTSNKLLGKLCHALPQQPH